MKAKKNIPDGFIFMRAMCYGCGKEEYVDSAISSTQFKRRLYEDGWRVVKDDGEIEGELYCDDCVCDIFEMSDVNNIKKMI